MSRKDFTIFLIVCGIAAMVSASMVPFAMRLGATDGVAPAMRYRITDHGGDGVAGPSERDSVQVPYNANAGFPFTDARGPWCTSRSAPRSSSKSSPSP